MSHFTSKWGSSCVLSFRGGCGGSEKSRLSKPRLVASYLLGLGLCFLGEQDSLDVGQHTTLGDWSHQTAACSTPRHYGWPAAGDVGWSCSSCCRGQRYLPTRAPQRPNIPWRQPGRLGHQRQRARHSCLCADDGGYVPRGNCRPARELRVLDLPFALPPLPRPDIFRMLCTNSICVNDNKWIYRYKGAARMAFYRKLGCPLNVP